MGPLLACERTRREFGALCRCAMGPGLESHSGGHVYRHAGLACVPVPAQSRSICFCTIRFVLLLVSSLSCWPQALFSALVHKFGRVRGGCRVASCGRANRALDSCSMHVPPAIVSHSFHHLPVRIFWRLGKVADLAK